VGTGRTTKRTRRRASMGRSRKSLELAIGVEEWCAAVEVQATGPSPAGRQEAGLPVWWLCEATRSVNELGTEILIYIDGRPV